MATKIEWTNDTWNPITGCTKISEGCANCYAEKMAKRLRGRFGYPAENPFKITYHWDKLNQPLKWRQARRIFVCSMGDLFHKDVCFEAVIEVLLIIKKCPQHTFIILTKRPKRMYDFFNKYTLNPFNLKNNNPLKNLWLGVSIENQKTADQRIPVLLQIPAAVRFVSVEPMLSPVDLRSDELKWCDRTESAHECDYAIDHLNWVICGGESGPNARPMRPDWARSLRDQCLAAGVPFFFKQWGGSNKKKAGRLLDGRVWNEYPGGEAGEKFGKPMGWAKCLELVRKSFLRVSAAVD